MSKAVTKYFVGPVSSFGTSHDNVTDEEVIFSIVTFPSGCGATTTMNKFKLIKKIKLHGARKNIIDVIKMITEKIS